MKHLKEKSKYNENYYEIPYEFKGATILQNIYSEESNLDDCFFGNFVNGEFENIGIGFEIEQIGLDKPFDEVLKEVKIVSTYNLC